MGRKAAAGLAPDASLAGALLTVAVSTGLAVAFHVAVERPMLAFFTRWFVPVRPDGTREAPLQGEVAKG